MSIIELARMEGTVARTAVQYAVLKKIEALIDHGNVASTSAWQPRKENMVVAELKHAGTTVRRVRRREPGSSEGEGERVSSRGFERRRGFCTLRLEPCNRE